MGLELELFDINEEADYTTLNCGVNSINKYLLDGDAYFEHIKKLLNTKLISYNNIIIGYFTMQFKLIKIEDTSEDYPCICLKYLCIDEKHQNNGVGTKILDYIVKTSRELSNFVGCRCLLIDAITTKIEWYKDRGFDFIENYDTIDLENNTTVKMMIDFRDNDLLNDYFEV